MIGELYKAKKGVACGVLRSDGSYGGRMLPTGTLVLVLEQNSGLDNVFVKCVTGETIVYIEPGSFELGYLELVS